MTQIGTFSLRGIVHDDFQYTFLLKTGALEAVAASAGLSAVSQDTSAANTVKLAVDGSKILGRLEIYELRSVEGITTGTVALKGGIKFTVSPHAIDTSPDEIPALGDNLVGSVDDSSNAGFVRKATTAETGVGKDNWLVVEVATDNSWVVAINV